MWNNERRKANYRNMHFNMNWIETHVVNPRKHCENNYIVCSAFIHVSIYGRRCFVRSVKLWFLQSILHDSVKRTTHRCCRDLTLVTSVDALSWSQSRTRSKNKEWLAIFFFISDIMRMQIRCISTSSTQKVVYFEEGSLRF